MSKKENLPLSNREKFLKEKRNDCICDGCGRKMVKRALPRRTKNSKLKYRFVCDCGHTALPRSNQEIARDLGFKD